MSSRLIHNLIIYRNQSSSAFAISEKPTAPINSAASVRIATVNEAIMKKLKIFLATLLVARCFGILELPMFIDS